MTRALAVACFFFPWTMASAETPDSLDATKQNSAAPAYLRGDQSHAAEPLESVAEALPGSLNADFADNAVAKDVPEEELSQADIMLQREQQDWLAVGVQKLSGDYRPETDLSAEELEELEEKRESVYSPTRFVDHYARLEQARINSSEPAPIDPAWSSQDFSTQSLWIPSREWTDVWTQSTPDLADRPDAPRENPYLRSMNLDRPADVAMDATTPQWKTPGATASSWSPSAPAPTRDRPPAAGSSQDALPESGAFAAPEAQPVTTPGAESPLRKEDISEKYFRNLDRF